MDCNQQTLQQWLQQPASLFESYTTMDQQTAVARLLAMQQHLDSYESQLHAYRGDLQEKESMLMNSEGRVQRYREELRVATVMARNQYNDGEDPGAAPV